jgi:hypothetical protein
MPQQGNRADRQENPACCPRRETRASQEVVEFDLVSLRKHAMHSIRNKKAAEAAAAAEAEAAQMEAKATRELGLLARMKRALRVTGGHLLEHG